jgi:hypothetical protein
MASGRTRTREALESRKMGLPPPTQRDLWLPVRRPAERAGQTGSDHIFLPHDAVYERASDGWRYTGPVAREQRHVWTSPASWIGSGDFSCPTGRPLGATACRRRLGYPSSSSSNVFASWRSTVSKPSVHPPAVERRQQRVWLSPLALALPQPGEGSSRLGAPGMWPAEWAGRAVGLEPGAGAAVYTVYASALSALKNASFQCIPGRP